MNVKYKGLTCSPEDKIYGFRRAVKPELRYLFDGKREDKFSFHTTDLQEAIQKYHEADRKFKEKVAVHEAAMNAVGESSAKVFPADILRKASVFAKQEGVHPSQRPVLHAGVNESEVEEFKKVNFDWNQRTYQAWDNLYNLIEAKGDLETPMMEQVDTRDPKQVALLIGMGEVNVAPEATWQNLIDFYIERKSTKPRNETQKKKFEREARSAFTKVASSFTDGMGTYLSKIERPIIREIITHTWPNPNTQRRNLVFIKAAVAEWQAHFGEMIMHGFFDKLIDTDALEYFKNDRRSFTPLELQKFLRNVEENESEEVQVIVSIMAQTGCRNVEATGLVADDVRVDGLVPHLVFHKNTLRIMGKGGLERAVPIEKELASRLKALVKGKVGQDRVFDYWGVQSRGNNLSRRLSKHVENGRPYDDAILSPYSLRHTFVDKLKAARVSTDVAEYMVGHKSEGSSKVFKKYGKNVPPKPFVDDMRLANMMEEWGYFG